MIAGNDSLIKIQVTKCNIQYYRFGKKNIQLKNLNFERVKIKKRMKEIKHLPLHTKALNVIYRFKLQKKKVPIYIVENHPTTPK